MEYENEELDLSKLDKLEKEDEPYDGFYPEEIDIVKVFFIYVNRKNKIIAIKNDNILIDENKLSKFELSMIMKKNKKYKNLLFEPLSLLKYNIDLSPHEVKNYLDNLDSYNFLKVEKNIQDIHWNDSIALFKDMNSLYIIYYEKNKNKKNNYTKRIKLTNKSKLRYTKKKLN
jgi:hypothetical protein